MERTLQKILSIFLVVLLVVGLGCYSYGEDESPPTDLTEQTDPTDPTDPIDPVDPTDPVDPADPVDPTDSADPVDPADPADPADSTDPGLLPVFPTQPLTTKLTINHILRVGQEETVINTGTIEGLEIGMIVKGLDYTLKDGGLTFLESSPEELALVEGENTINLYYEVLDFYIPESPDFPPDQGETIDAPYIEEFAPGSLGPFQTEDNKMLRSFNMMESESYEDGINNKIWPQPGSLNINKTGEPVPGTGNQWEITLELEGKNLKKTTDIVLIIDRSGSMKGDKMTNAKAAAEAFVNTLLNDQSDDNIRIAIVSFADDVTVNSGFQGYSGKQTLINAIEGLQAREGTYTQAGIKQGSELLKGSEADYKNLVLLSDGAATYSYEINDPDSYLELCYSGFLLNLYRTTSSVPEDHFNYSTSVGYGTYEYTLYKSYHDNVRYYYNYYRHGASAVAEAGFAKNKDQVIYSIALDAGTEGEWTLGNVANPGNYYSTSDPTSLQPIFLEIAGRISYAATNVIVTDQLGDMYSILGINSSNYNSLIIVSHGTVSYDTSTDTIIWNIGTISEGNHYWMKYTVALDYSADGGKFYLANKPTYVDYKNIDGDNAKKYFPIPEFRLRALTFTKSLNNSKCGDENKEFDIILEGPTGQYKRIWAISLKPEESKAIKGLLPGTYTVKEIVPMNFKLVNMSSGAINKISGNSYQLVIGENDWNVSVNIVNERDNDGWFYDDNENINNFSVGHENSSSNNASIPTNKSLFAKIIDFILPHTMEDNFEFDNA